ncbi:MAG: hypothetical protein ACR2O0_14125 [Rhizobiaceae bacterium]
MKRNAKSRKSAERKNGRRENLAADSPGNKKRRRFFHSVRNGIAAVILVGATGFALAEYVKSEMHEHDLSRINNGIPTVVQIHDPQCPLCRELQKQTRSAMDAIKKETLDYVVADIRTKEGQAFASSHAVQHVTLLLFNGRGSLQKILQGPRSSSELRGEFQKLL